MHVAPFTVSAGKVIGLAQAEPRISGNKYFDKELVTAAVAGTFKQRHTISTLNLVKQIQTPIELALVRERSCELFRPWSSH
jgi:hypothetical protein